jgi:hypothetical protein
MNSAQLLQHILSEQEERIRKSYPSDDVIFPIIEIIRSLDFETYAQRISKEKLAGQHMLEKYRFGWSLAFYLFYKDLSFDDDIPLFEFGSEERGWVDSIIQHCGSIQLSRQYLDYEKAGLVDLLQEGEKEFVFRHAFQGIGDEAYDQISLNYYHGLVEKILEDKVKPTLDQLPAMRKKLKNIVDVFQERFIQYKATVEVEVFYRRLGYLIMMTSQVVDDFDELDTFGGYSYGDYLDFAERLFMTGLLHRDCCFALAEKTNYKVNLRTIMTYGFSKQLFLEMTQEVYGWQKEKTEQIASSFAITRENYQYHLTYPGLAPVPYYELGNDVWVRSTVGCITMPIFFLNRELKRRFPKDYFEAVNRREERFRKQLYDLFKYNWIKCVHQNVDIGTTDIDAVVFDTRRKILGLFQLKWQDSFYTSMQERRSRISNMIPKSVEWIDKVNNWISVNDVSSILKKCRIEGNEIKEVHLFVLSRNHVHFTNQELDERAIWGSWFQLIEASSKVKDPTNANPIAEMAVKLRFLNPASRKEMEGEMKFANMELRFGGYTVKMETK